MSERKPIVSVTAKDCTWSYYNGTGKGGQNRNKRSNCVRCQHEPSGAMGKAEDERDQAQNKKLAFQRMAASKEFQGWIKLETMRRSGEMAEVEARVEQAMSPGNLRTDVKDEQGRWVPVKGGD